MEEKKGTIFPNPNFSETKGAELLKGAMKGITPDEKTIWKVLVAHDSLQRLAIEDKYKSLYGTDLVDDFKDELDEGPFRDTVVALVSSKFDPLVHALHDSFSKTGSDFHVITEILCCRDSESVERICWWYNYYFERSLEDDIDSNLTGEFRAAIKSMLTVDRPEDEEEIEKDVVLRDAKKLKNSGIGYKKGSEEGALVTLFRNRSFAHITKVFEEYQVVAKREIEDSIASEFEGETRDGLVAIVKRIRKPFDFFAERLNTCLLGSATDDKSLIRIIVSRSEEDLCNIKVSYKNTYGTSLSSDIKGDTKGNYKKLLLAIINNSE